MQFTKAKAVRKLQYLILNCEQFWAITAGALVKSGRKSDKMSESNPAL